MPRSWEELAVVRRVVGKAEAGIAVSFTHRPSSNPFHDRPSLSFLSSRPSPKMKFTTAITALALAAVARAASTYTVSGMRVWSGRSGPSCIFTSLRARSRSGSGRRTDNRVSVLTLRRLFPKVRSDREATSVSPDSHRRSWRYHRIYLPAPGLRQERYRCSTHRHSVDL